MIQEKTLSQTLAENLKYYTDDVNKRCVYDGECRYSGETLNLDTDGCFVGRLLPKGIRKRVDEYYLDGDDSSIDDLVDSIKYILKDDEELPKIISDNVCLMGKFQNLHDGSIFWGASGLNDKGKEVLERIIQDSSELDKKDFSFCLD